MNAPKDSEEVIAQNKRGDFYILESPYSNEAKLLLKDMNGKVVKEWKSSGFSQRKFSESQKFIASKVVDYTQNFKKVDHDKVDENNQIWIKNLDTGEEKLAFEIKLSPYYNEENLRLVGWTTQSNR